MNAFLNEDRSVNFFLNFNLFIKQKDRSATYIDMHEIQCRDTLKYTCISNTKHNVNTQHIQLNKKYLAVWE